MLSCCCNASLSCTWGGVLAEFPDFLFYIKSCRCLVRFSIDPTDISSYIGIGIGVSEECFGDKNFSLLPIKSECL